MMDWPRLDTSAWNLTAGLAMTVLAASVVPACGPTIVLEGQTDTIADSDGPDSTPNTTVGSPCDSSEQCEGALECIDGMCTYFEPDDDYYDDYCLDDGCCYDECCYDGCDYQECYSDEECGTGALCTEFGECRVLPVLPECDDPQVGSQTLPLPGNDPIISLAFLDANGDDQDDLIVGRQGGAWLVMGIAAPPIPLPLPAGDVLVHAASGHFDGDGLLDLVYSNGEDGFSVLLGDGMGSFSEVYSVVTGPLRELHILDWNGDGASDVATLLSTGATAIHLGDGSGAFIEQVDVLPEQQHEAIAVGRIDGDGYGDLVVQDGSEGVIYLGNPEGDTAADLGLPDDAGVQRSRRLMAGDIDGGGETPVEIVGRTNKSDDWTLLQGWRDQGDGFEQFPIGYVVLESDLGDVDGDGALDVVMGGQDRLTVVRGAPGPGGGPLFLCEHEVILGVAPVDLAVGDIDGDGRGNVAFSDGSDVYLFAPL